MGRRPLIAGGVAAVILLLGGAYLLAQRDSGGKTADPANASAKVTATAPTTTAPTTTTPPAPTTPAPRTVAPATAGTPKAPAVTAKPAAANPDFAQVTVRFPVTVAPTGSNGFQFYVKNITPVDSVVNVHLAVQGDKSYVTTLPCTPHPSSIGTCQIPWNTTSHDVVVTYTVSVESSDAHYTSAAQHFQIN